MKRILSAATAAAIIWLGAAAAQTQKKTTAPAKKTTTTTVTKSSASAKKATTSASTAHKGGTTKKASTPRKPAVTWRNRQTTPSQDRYREIQTALVSRGYLSDQDANGVWNQSSIDALKRFQAEQNIDSSGKINSLSLIALGLGPKRDSAPVVPPKPQLDGQ